MKKVISIILALFLCCSLFVSTVSAAEPTEGFELPLAGTTRRGIHNSGGGSKLLQNPYPPWE